LAIPYGSSSATGAFETALRCFFAMLARVGGFFKIHPHGWLYRLYSASGMDPLSTTG
jgi:hypothetical protein